MWTRSRSRPRPGRPLGSLFRHPILYSGTGAFLDSSCCDGQGMRNGTTPINPPLWFPLRGSPGSFPHSLLSTSKSCSMLELTAACPPSASLRAASELQCRLPWLVGLFHRAAASFRPSPNGLSSVQSKHEAGVCRALPGMEACSYFAPTRTHTHTQSLFK